MRIPDHLNRTKFGFNMTPMIDVVFLLIIFFLVSGHLAKQEAQMELPLPLADSGVNETAFEAKRLIVNITEDGQLVFSGKPVSKDQLVNRLTVSVAEHGEDLEVRIRGDRRVPYAVVEPILVSCAKAGVWNVTFSVYQRKERG